MRESTFVLMVASLIAILLLAASLTGNSWPSPGFLAFVLACWLVYTMAKRH